MARHLLSKRRGFTLIELLVVISIISLVSSIGLVALNSTRAKARDGVRKQTLRQVERALTLYYDKYGRYPVGGCDVSAWSGSSACPTSYIDGQTVGGGQFQEFMPRLPLPPNGAYAYSARATDNYQSFNLQATNVESETVLSTHPFAICPSVCGGGTWCASHQNEYTTVYSVSTGYSTCW